MAYRDARLLRKILFMHMWLLIAAEKITDQEYKSYRKDYEDRQENLNRDNPQCEYILEGKSFSHMFAVGYAKQLLKDVKKRWYQAVEKSRSIEEFKLNIQ